MVVVENIWKFMVPELLIFGNNSIEGITDILTASSASKFLVVTGRIVRSKGLAEPVLKAINKCGKQYEIFDSIEGETVTAHIEDGLRAFRENECDEIIAIGGGSPLDAAKLISVMTTNPGKIIDYRGIDKIPAKGARVIAIPTTAGTGSEVTRYAAVIDTLTSEKILLTSPYLIADTAVVDPALTVSCPRQLTAATGIDALTHAIEAYVSRKANPASDMFAINAINMISRNIRAAWSDGKDIDAREKVMLGSMCAGIAFSNASVALVHGMSRPIGANFSISHGVSNAALLVTVMEFSNTGNQKRYAEIAAAMGGDIAGMPFDQAAKYSVDEARQLIKDLEIPTLGELGINRNKLVEYAPRMAEAAIVSGSPGNNPVIATKEEITGLYLKAFDGI